VNADSLAPLVYEYTVDGSSALAFATYVERISEWWLPTHTADPETLTTINIEPFVGGRIYAVHQTLGEPMWGRITVWEPGRRLAHTFTLAQDERFPSEVVVDFGPAGNGTSTLRLSHGGWNPQNVAFRQKFDDWPRLLGRMVALLNDTT
jgi:hypothetical protein